MITSKGIIITCAVTGSIHTPSMSPSLPVTAQEIAEAALGAAEAGAAIVHLHARNPGDGRPDQTPEAFAPFSQGDQEPLERSREFDHRRIALHVGRRACGSRGRLEAGNREPEHGIDEFRFVPDAQQVRRVRTIIEGLGLEIATPDDARRILELKGAHNVAF
jgi:hypothetical protein